MKILDKRTGEWKTIQISSSTTVDYDSLPVGSIIDYDGDEVPEGYELSEDGADGGTWIGEDTPSNAYNLWINPANEGLDSISEVVNSIDGNEKNLAPSVYTVKNNFISKPKVLWTNPNPTSIFAAQNITFNTDDYDVYEIFCRYSISNSSVSSTRSLKGSGIHISHNGRNANSTPVRVRLCDYVDDRTIAIDGCYVGAPATNNVNNEYIIPVYVIGYKLNPSTVEEEFFKRPEGVVLWTNPNPNVSFGTQSVTLSTDNYDVYEIYYKHWYNNPYALCQKSYKGMGAVLFTVMGDRSIYRRLVEWSNDFTLNFLDATDNSSLIPVKIIGYKTNFFS